MDEWLLWIWRCWHRLNQDRPWWSGGMGAPMPGAIPWMAIQKWCEHHKYSCDEQEFLDRCIKAMDGVFLAHHQQQQAKK